MPPQNKITRIILIVAIALFLFGGGYRVGEYSATRALTGASYGAKVGSTTREAQKRDVDFAIFWETWDKLSQKYIDKGKIQPQKMLYGAVRGMVASVEDPYTFFLTPEENKQSKDDLGGKFEGIGAQLGLKSNRIVVIAPLKDSPAEQAGVRAGDFVNKVNGVSTKNWTLVAAVSKIRGPEGTSVKLTLEREGRELDVTIARRQIQVASVEVSTEKSAKCQENCPQVGYIKIIQFGENTNEEWDTAVEAVRGQWKAGHIKGLVLDLRDNPGGFLESSVYVASEFLPRGQLVVKQESSVGDNREYRTLRDGTLQDIPIVVLLNQGSASASEILAGALRDHKKAVTVGEKSFGKGSVQEALDLRGGAGLHVTVSKWILPSGEWINSKGIEPQHKVANVIAEGNTLTRAQDVQLERAVELIIK